MIVRKQEDGSLILVSQNDHAKLSGIFAARWGNRNFERPHPFESVMRGTAFHDIGWSRYDTGPVYDAEKKFCPSFFQVPLDATQLGAFQTGIDWLTGIDRYAGLMISRHRTGLWHGRYGAFTHPAPPPPRAMTKLLTDFIAYNEAIQTEQMLGIDRAEFDVNFRLLQVWDVLSLHICTDFPKPDYIDVVPTGYGVEGAAGVRMTLMPLDGRRIEIRPYPFEVKSLPFDYVYRTLDTSDFPDEAAFRKAYFAATPKTMSYEYV
jgi:hypothetical protein